MLACMRTIYGLILALFDEAYSVAKIEGVSFASTKAASAGAGRQKFSHFELWSSSAPAKKRKVPPPPLAPADKAFTSAELARFDGKGPGKPILTSVLGRVYDVTGAKESFGPGGPYEMFAGHDGTYNLAVMTLKKHTVDKTDYTLDAEDAV
ncbi:MSBP1 [Symbiodinium sp. CCMP2592]|nr:MSBP1 [Symbiodinium sp. CCMP2592]